MSFAKRRLFRLDLNVLRNFLTEAEIQTHLKIKVCQFDWNISF